jgi:hypothetical protein
MQSDPDYTQTLLDDPDGRGIGWSYRNMAAYAPHLVGEWIWILDDDDCVVSQTFVADLRVIAAVHDPDVVLVRMDHGARGILPGKNWQRKPVMGDIGCSAFVVKRAIWQKHAHHFSDSYAGDFDFIASIFDKDYEMYWFDCVASAVQRISLGMPE